MKDHEIILAGGMSAEEVLRIGGVVHRTKSSNYNLVHSVLRYLEEEGFSSSPRFLGIDEQGREMLSFIEGEVPRECPLNFQQKIEAITCLRNFHDLMSKSKLCGVQETVCHNDFAPWNIIVKEGAVVGIIDFDEVAPGKRVDDVAYFLWTFLDFGVADISDIEQIKSIESLVDSYALKDREELTSAFTRQQQRILKFRQKVVREEEDESLNNFSKGAILRIQKSMRWVELNRNKIEHALGLR